MLSTLVLIPSALVAFGAALSYAVTRMEPGSASRALRRQRCLPLAHELPYWALTDEGVLVGVDLTFSAALELTGLDSDCMSDDELDQVDHSLHSLLQVLPAGATLQWIHTTDQDHAPRLRQYREQVAAESSLAVTAAREKMDAIVASPHLRRSRLHLVCSLPNKRQGVGARAGMPKKFQSLTPEQHDDAVADALRLRDQVARSLRSANIGARPLCAGDMRALIYGSLNPTRQAAVPPPAARPEQTLREQLVFSGLREDMRDLRLDGQRMRAISLAGLPHETNSALLERLTVALPFCCRVTASVEILDDQKTLDQLKARRNRADALAQLSQRRNQEAEAQFRDVEELIDQQLDASLRLVRMSLTVVLAVRDDDEALANIEAQTAEVLRVIASLGGAEALVEDYAQLDTFLHSLPGNARHGGRWHSCTSRNAAHCLLAWQSWPGHPTPRILVENGRNYLVGLDPFEGSLDNPNAFMAGVSGSGKSVTTNYLLLHLLASGTRALIIDIGGSYRKLIELYGGDYLSFEREADPAINLFYDPADVVEADGELDPLRLQFMLTILEALLVEPTHPALSRMEGWVLGQAVRKVYDGATAPPILSDLGRTLLSMEWNDPAHVETARWLEGGLRFWIDGPNGSLLNRQSTIRLTSDLAAFDLKGLPDNVREPVVLIISGMIWNLLDQHRSEKKIVVFDEVWKLLLSPASAALIAELYRTSRKYRASILSISQSVEDFIGSDIASALVNNSATAYLLRHKSGHDDIAKVFHLNSRERAVFGDLEMRRGEFSEVLVLSGSEHHFVGRIVLTPLEYWLTTTHPPDSAALDGVRAEHPHLTLIDALRVCAQRWPRGVEAGAI